MTLSATCPNSDTRVGVEAPRPTKAKADLLVVPDTAWEAVQYWLPAAPQVGVQTRLDFTPKVWLLLWNESFSHLTEIYVTSLACADPAGWS